MDESGLNAPFAEHGSHPVNGVPFPDATEVNPDGAA
jgi:hypothetical protein